MMRVLFTAAAEKLGWWWRTFSAWRQVVDRRSAVAAVIGRELVSRRDDARTVPVRIRRAGGTRVRVRPVGSDLATIAEIFHEEVYGGLANVVRAPASVIDLGAHVGLSSLYFLRMFPSARVLAVEPNPESFALLETNLRPWIVAGRCRLVRGAAWSDDCLLAPSSDNEPHAHAGFSVRPAPPGDSEPIQGYSMETLLGMTDAPIVDVVKMDVEGAESALLSADVDWLRTVRCLAVEFHGASRSELKFDALMARAGFVVVEQGRHTVVALQSFA